MYAYSITTYCDKSCDDPECTLDPPKKTLLMLHLDPTSEEEQALVRKIIELCKESIEDPDGVIDMRLDGSSTADAFQSLEGIFSLIGTTHALLRDNRAMQEEEDEFKEESLDVDLNI